jgi:hypothetical protein
MQLVQRGTFAGTGMFLGELIAMHVPFGILVQSSP